MKLKRNKQHKPPKTSSTSYSLAMNRLLGSGVRFSMENIDKKYLTLPRNITDVPDRELGEYLYHMTQQKSYLRTLVAIAQVEVMDLQRAYDEMFSKIYNSSSGGVNDRKEAARNNKLVMEYRTELDRAQAVFTLADGNLESLNDLVFALSREITRREKSREQEERLYNVGNKRRGDKHG